METAGPSIPEPAPYRPARRRWYWLLHALTLAVVVGILSVPGTVTQIADAGCFAVPLVAVLWLGLLVRFFRFAGANPRPFRELSHLAATLVLVAVALKVDDARYPYAVALYLSRPSMDRTARQILAAPAAAPLPDRCRLGLFLAEPVERCQGGVRFHVGYGHWLDDTGFAYIPAPTVPPEDGFQYRAIGDGWYEFVRG